MPLSGSESGAPPSRHRTRNRLLRFDVYTSASTTGLALGSVISGVFGMNISPAMDIFTEDPDDGGRNFYVTTIAIAVSVVCVIILFLCTLYRFDRSITNLALYLVSSCRCRTLRLFQPTLSRFRLWPVQEPLQLNPLFEPPSRGTEMRVAFKPESATEVEEEAAQRLQAMWRRRMSQAN